MIIMAGILAKIGNSYNVMEREYTLTDIADIAYLPTTTKDATGKFKGDSSFDTRPPIGSVCKVVTNNGLVVYMLNETGWVEA